MKARKVKGLDPAGPLIENAARIVRVRLDELRSFAPEALDPKASRTQHDMRIAAKRLRYVLEATGFCFGQPADVARRRARDLQDLLGEIHDADVMVPRIREHRRRLRDRDAEAVRDAAGDARDLDPDLARRTPHRTSYRGLDVLEIYLLARRQLLFDRFVALWETQEKRGTWRALERVADRELEAGRERRAAIERTERARRELERAEHAEREAAECARQAAAQLAEAERGTEPSGPETT